MLNLTNEHFTIITILLLIMSSKLASCNIYCKSLLDLSLVSTPLQLVIFYFFSELLNFSFTKSSFWNKFYFIIVWIHTFRTDSVIFIIFIRIERCVEFVFVEYSTVTSHLTNILTTYSQKRDQKIIKQIYNILICL